VRSMKKASGVRMTTLVNLSSTLLMEP